MSKLIPKLVFFYIIIFKAIEGNNYEDYEDCICLRSNKWTIDKMMKNHKDFWVGITSEKNWWYKYYLNCEQSKKNLIENPKYYYEYHHNLMVYNQRLTNSFDYCTDSLIEIEKLAKMPCPKLRKETEEKLVGYKKNINYNFDLSNNIKETFRKCYTRCIELGHYRENHLYDRAFIEFMDGNVIEAAELADKYIINLKNNIQILDANQLLLLGELHIDLCQFSQAVKYLSESLESDPTNKKTYFERAIAHFETGKFDEALQDYLSSHRIMESKSTYKASTEFTQALVEHLYLGACESVIDFFPSLCNSIYGLGDGLWTTVKHPIDTSSDFSSFCYEIGQNAYEYCKNLDWNTVDGYACEFKDFCDNFMILNETEKGEKIGYLLGKYGIDVFLGKMACKGVIAYKNLKNANRFLNLEAMTISNTNKEAIVTAAVKREAEIKNYFNNIKIQWDKQNKHILGKPNYITGGGTIEISDSKLESLIKSKAGTGQKVVGEIGVPGYKERVDFGEVIGMYAHELQGKPTQYISTTKGIIIYAKDGVHIVPSNPNGIIK